eukprot:Opistho-2@38831
MPQSYCVATFILWCTFSLRFYSRQYAFFAREVSLTFFVESMGKDTTISCILFRFCRDYCKDLWAMHIHGPAHSHAADAPALLFSFFGLRVFEAQGGYQTVTSRRP